MTNGFTVAWREVGTTLAITVVAAAIIIGFVCCVCAWPNTIFYMVEGSCGLWIIYSIGKLVEKFYGAPARREK